MQKIEDGKLCSKMKPSNELYLDGSHNVDAAFNLNKTLKNLPEKKLCIIIGMINTKDPAAYIRQFSNCFSITTITIPSEDNAIPADELKNKLEVRWWTSENEQAHMCVGSTVGPTIFVKICAWSTAQISREMKKQVIDEFGEIPKDMKLINCVGGGSSAAGFWNEWIDHDNVELIGVEAGGPEGSSMHAAPLTNNSPLGVLHGATQYVIQDNQGEIEETASISAGLDYPGVSPLHCFLKETGRARYTSASDEEAINAFQLVSKMEGFVSPSLEPSHAFAEAIKIAPSLSKDTIIVVDSCGDSAKDSRIIAERLGYKI